jgi:hypothetical protein
LDRGSIIYGNASSVTTVLDQGGADEVLTSDGTDIAWAAAGGGGISHDGSTADGVLTYKDADEATVEPNLTFDGTGLKIKEAADAAADTEAYGQIWVNNETPNELYFTNDAGNNVRLTKGGNTVSNIAEYILYMDTAYGNYAAVSQGWRVDGVAGATTIATIWDNRAAYVKVIGRYGDNVHLFQDVVHCNGSFVSSTTSTVHSITMKGSPASRTYTVSGASLQLAMGSGTYNVLIYAVSLTWL